VKSTANYVLNRTWHVNYYLNLLLFLKFYQVVKFNILKKSSKYFGYYFFFISFFYHWTNNHQMNRIYNIEIISVSLTGFNTNFLLSDVLTGIFNTSVASLIKLLFIEMSYIFFDDCRKIYNIVIHVIILYI
jgi:hypothetical protein